MIEISRTEMLELASVYVRSNTPRYFFSHIRAAAVVQRVASEHSEAEIAAEIQRIAALDNVDADTILALPALLAALSQVAKLNHSGLFQTLPLDRIPWGEHFIYMVKQLIGSESEYRQSVSPSSHDRSANFAVSSSSAVSEIQGSEGAASTTPFQRNTISIAKS